MRKILYFLICSFLLTSCLVQHAKRSKKQHLTIFSDCLNEKDVRIFKQFEKKEEIDLHIQYFETDSLLAKIEKEGYNCKADLIIVNSTFSIHKLKEKKLLQAWQSEIIDKRVPKHFKVKNNQWIGVGVNPYALACNDTIYIHDNLKKLIRSKKTRLHSDLFLSKDFIPLYTQFLYSKKKKEIDSSLISKIKFTTDRNLPKDSVLKNIFISTYSSIIHDSILTNKSLMNINKGSYYNLYCAGIIKQSPNFYNAKVFLEYITENRQNEKINNIWKTLPITLSDIKHKYAYQNIPIFINTEKYYYYFSRFNQLERYFEKHTKDRLIKVNNPSDIADQTIAKKQKN